MQILSNTVGSKDVKHMHKGRNGRRRANHSLLKSVIAALCVVLLPPLGIVLTWRSRWSGMVKYCMTGLAVGMMVLAVALLPSADNRVNGGIEMVGRNADVEIYGPELPTAMVTGYAVYDGSESVLAPAETSSVTLYYAAAGAECYHEYECKFAYASSQKLTLYEAHCLGYKPCGLCQPPEYVPGA